MKKTEETKVFNPSARFAEIFEFDNLLAAHFSAMKDKNNDAEIIDFEANREDNLIELQNELIWHSYIPSPMREREVTDPKRRIINIPAYRDRVLQQAIYRVLSPIFERRQITHSYACRKNKGTHAAAVMAREYIRKVMRTGNKVYFLKCDIHHYYASINHRTLKILIRRVIKEQDVLWLLDTIIDDFGIDGVSIPLGAVTSQMFANIYLDALDHLIKDDMGVKYYVRYMDDFVLFNSDKNELSNTKKIIANFLTQKLQLTLNQKTRIVTGSEGCDFCGYRLFTTHVLPRKRNVKKARRRLKKLCRLYKLGRIDDYTVKQVWASFLGYAKHCSCHATTVAIWQELNKILKGD